MRRRIAVVGELVTILAGLASMVSACSDGPEANGEETSRSPIIGGAVDSVHTATAMFSYRSLEHNGDWWTCSASLISPDTMLTAGHCTADAGDLGNVVQFCQNAKQCSAGEQVVGTTRVSTYTYYRPGLGESLDIGLVTLDRAPAVGAYSLRATVNVGQPVTLVGYGWDKPGVSSGSGVRRSLGTIVTNDQSAFTNPPIDFSKFFMTGNRSQGACYADSGGPMLFAGVIVGIGSLTASIDCSDARSAYSKLDLDWINRSLQSPPRLTITSWVTNLCLSAGATVGELALVDQCVNSGSQFWKLRILTGGWIMLQDEASGSCLNGQLEGYFPYTTSCDENNQWLQWKKLEGGTSRIQNRATGLCLVPGADAGSYMSMKNCNAPDPNLTMRWTWDTY